MNKFTPVVGSTRNLSTLISERLRAQIVAGVLIPGERLPPQRELAESLNVSRSALREATRVLESAGVLETFHGRGTFVAKGDLDASLKAALRPANSGAVAARELAELCDVRRILEPQSAALAASSIKRKEVGRLRALCDHADALLARSPSDLDAISRMNNELHSSIARASGNRVLARMVDDLMQLLSEIRRHNLRRPGRAHESWCEHRGIVDALDDGDAAAAQKLMLLHIDRAAHTSLVADAGGRRRR